MTITNCHRKQILTIFLIISITVLFVHNVNSHYFLGDDAFISFRYALNLIEGKGLVWNVGEYVEGYTNFLWVLLMAASLALGIAPELASNVLSIISGALLIYALGTFSARKRTLMDPFLWLPLVILSISKSFTAWSTSGLETMFFTLVIFAALITFLKERETKHYLPIKSALLFSIGALTRPEGNLFLAIAGCFFLFDIVTKKRSLKTGIIWSLPCLLIIGTHLLWRYSYYGFWLPNTFYAKVPGTWWEQGFFYLSLFVKSYHIIWFLPFLLVPPLLKRKGPHYSAVLFFTVIAIYLFYVVSVGGDRFEFRFLVVIFPYFYWLIAEGMAACVSFIPIKAIRQGAVIILCAALAYTTSTSTFKEKGIQGIVSIKNITEYANSRIKQGKFLRKQIEQGVLPADIILALGGAGAVPYYTGWTTIDRRGLNDLTIAHTPITQRKRIAHERDATPDYLTKRGVIVFDRFNRLLFPNDNMLKKDKVYRYGGQPIRVRGIKLDNRHLIFATFISDEKLAETFKGHTIIKQL